MVAWEKRTIAEALDAGRHVETLPGVRKSGVTRLSKWIRTRARSCVWRAWDHLVPPGEPPASYPRLIDPNYAARPDPDWTHANAPTTQTLTKSSCRCVTVKFG